MECNVRLNNTLLKPIISSDWILFTQAISSLHYDQSYAPLLVTGGMLLTLVAVSFVTQLLDVEDAVDDTTIAVD